MDVMKLKHNEDDWRTVENSLEMSRFGSELYLHGPDGKYGEIMEGRLKEMLEKTTGSDESDGLITPFDRLKLRAKSSKLAKIIITYTVIPILDGLDGKMELM